VRRILPRDVTVVHFGAFGENGSMTEITVTEARARLSDVVDEARVGHDPVFLTRRGRRVAAVIDADDLQRLIEAAEDLADVQAARAARAEMAETGEATIPWDQVKADLGMA
jgi:antitoxin Phd